MKKKSEEEKQNKTIAIMYCVTSIIFYIIAIISFINKNSMGTMYLCLGSTFLCLESLYLNKAKEVKEAKNDKKKNNN